MTQEISRLLALGSAQAELVRRSDLLVELTRLATDPEAQRRFVHVTRRLEAGPRGRLRDGTFGYFVRGLRTDDCWAAALATCLQVPIDEVPDPRLDERLRAGEDPAEVDRSAWLALDRWLADRGYRMTVHCKPPTSRKRWIGIVQLPGWFQSHCLVMSRDEVLFDPAAAVLRRDRVACGGSRATT